MKIEHISFITQNQKSILSADLIFNGKKPENVYISIDSQYKDYITPDASPFLAMVLLPCMQKGENIQIEGSISKKLYQNIESIMHAVLNWNLGFKKITITAQKIIKDQAHPKYTASFFSGGVDSFYTYLKHQKQISHFILIHGFDIELENKLLFESTLNNIKTISKKTKTKVITVDEYDSST